MDKTRNVKQSQYSNKPKGGDITPHLKKQQQQQPMTRAEMHITMYDIKYSWLD